LVNIEQHDRKRKSSGTCARTPQRADHGGLNVSDWQGNNACHLKCAAREEKACAASVTHLALDFFNIT